MDFQFMHVGGLSVRCVDINSESKNAILLVHGLGGAIESWAGNIDELARELRVTALDLPGFGYSDKPRMNYTIRFYRDFVAKFIGALGVSPLTVVGSSLGGHIALELAISRPDLVSKLVLVSPAGALPRSFTGTPALKRYVGVLQAKSPQEVKKALFALDNRPVDDEYAKVVYERLAMPGAKQAFLSALKGSAQAPRLTGRLDKIKAPSLVIWGKEDAMIPAKFVEPFARMKNSRIVLLERSGHRPHADRPQVFNRLVANFALEG